MHRRLDFAVAALAIALLAVSFAPWDETTLGASMNAWQAPKTIAVTIAVALASAVTWLARAGRGWRLAAGASAAGSAVWFFCFTRLGVPSIWSSDVGWTDYASQPPPRLVGSGPRAGLPVGSVLIAALAVLMVAALVVDLARHRPTPDERRRAASIIPVVAAVAVVAVGFAPWWWSRGFSIVTVNAWSASTVWSASLGATAVALGIWLLVRTPTGRAVATSLAVGAGAVDVGYTTTRPTRPPAAGPRRYVDYLPPSPFHRDVLFSYDGASGAEIGAYVGVGLIVLIGVVMLARVAGEFRWGRADQVGDRAAAPAC